MEYSKYIRFLNANDTYAPGENLEGQVVLTLEKARKLKGDNFHLFCNNFVPFSPMQTLRVP